MSSKFIIAYSGDLFKIAKIIIFKYIIVMESVNILGVKVNTFTKKQVLAKIQEFLTNKRQYYLVTPNPEIILRATSHDEELFYILNRADLALADGFGLKMAAWLMGINLPRITGADLVKDILRLAEKEGRRAAIFNRRGGLSKEGEIKSALAKKFPQLEILVEDVGCEPPYDFSRVIKFSPQIIFSALGAPYQEKFIFHNLAELPSVKIGVGVGGAFDFLSGRARRAPKIFRIIGLEWLWRFLKQPWRWPRIYQAVIVFPLKFLSWRFILPRRYRRNAACLLYKKEGDSYKILIVERIDEPGHWQLPQGGTDGEDFRLAGARELSEELNTDKFKAITGFKNLYRYEFVPAMRRFKEIYGYRGQKQSLFIAEFTGSDIDLKVNFWEHRAWRWVDAEKLVAAVHPVRRAAAKIFMEKFREVIKK